MSISCQLIVSLKLAGLVSVCASIFVFRLCHYISSFLFFLRLETIQCLYTSHILSDVKPS